MLAAAEALLVEHLDQAAQAAAVPEVIRELMEPLTLVVAEAEDKPHRQEQAAPASSS